VYLHRESRPRQGSRPDHGRQHAQDLRRLPAVAAGSRDRRGRHCDAGTFALSHVHAALKAGENVYVEKRLAHDMEQGEEMAQAAEKSGKTVQLGT